MKLSLVPLNGINHVTWSRAIILSMGTNQSCDMLIKATC